MTEHAPARIGHYTITREAGRGGMGVVYLARDTRLDRDVAIKALPPEVASDPARLERFEREARTLAGLSHPNLAGIYGVEEQDEAKYLVLEYVDGETLADRLDRGPLPVDDAVELAVQIAAGIEAAHDAGVIHRDLKPANIKITSDGVAKVLDFGLARLDDGSISSSGALDSPTITTPQNSPTIEGAILGTAAYMSPEQARGRRVDKRTDIWSFGVVLYEMLVGASPFVGETAGDSIGAVLHKDLDLAKLPPQTPPHVRRVLSRCFVRDKNQRYRDIGDVRIELLRSASTDVAVGSSRRNLTLPLLVPVALIAAVVAWWLKPAPPAATRTVTHASLLFPSDYEAIFWPQPRLSADGQRLLFRAIYDDEGYVAVRDLDDPELRIIPSTSGFAIDISPDGRWLAVESNGTITKQLIEGGPAITICRVENLRGLVWTQDDSIIFAPDRFGPLHRIDVAGGEPSPLYELDNTDRLSDRHPEMLPNAAGVLFHRSAGDGAGYESSHLMVAELNGTAPRVLINGATHARYVNSGHLVYQRETTLFAAGFDLHTLEFTTPESVVLEGLSMTPAGAPAQFDLSSNGTLVYFTGDRTLAERKIVSLDFNGVSTQLTEETGTHEEIVPSDDGQFIVVEVNHSSGMDRIRVIELARDLVSPVPVSPNGGDYNPVWSPDNRWIAFSSRRESVGAAIRQIYRFRVGSASPPELFIRSATNADPEDWSTDGRFLVVMYENEGGETDLGVVRLDDAGTLISENIEPLIEWDGWQSEGRLSPDDQWLGFRSYTDLTGVQIFVANTKDPTVSAQISVGGGNYFAWAPNKNAIYYVDENTSSKTVFEVEYTISETGDFLPSPPRPLLDLDSIDDLDSFYMNPEGTAFIIGEPVNAMNKDEFRFPNLILNWDTYLKAVVPLTPNN